MKRGVTPLNLKPDDKILCFLSFALILLTFGRRNSPQSPSKCLSKLGFYIVNVRDNNRAVKTRPRFIAPQLYSFATSDCTKLP